MATSEHVTRMLLDATGPLAELHRRVLEAGCEVDPEWRLGVQDGYGDRPKALAEHGYSEAVAVLVVEVGYELSREDHILALQSDQDLITRALRRLTKSSCMGDGTEMLQVPSPFTSDYFWGRF
eukprot:s45_g31.t1